MKYVLASIFLGLGIWTIVAVSLTPPPLTEGKAPLVWTTDPNPQRDPQVEWFNKAYPGCELRIDPDNSGVMKVVVQSSAKMGPDIIGHVNENSYQTYVDAGILWDVTEYAAQMGFGIDTLPESVRPLVLMRDPETLELRQFLYPCNVFHQYIIYNKNIFDKHGVPYPPEDLTWDQYIDLAKKLTIFEEEDNRVPVVFGAADMSPEICIWTHGGDLMNEDGTRSVLDQPEAIAGMVYYHALLYKHMVEPSPTQKAGVTSQGGWGGGSYRNWFGEGRIAMLVGARWMLIQFRRFIDDQWRGIENWAKGQPNSAELLQDRDAMLAAWREANKDNPGASVVPVRMGACLMPRFADGKRYTKFGARCVGINKMSPNREKALNFMQYIAGEKYSELINLGADSKPGNRKYVSIEQFRHADWPGEEEVHLMSIKAIPDGKVTPRSMFIPNATVGRYFWQAKDQLVANPDMTGAEIAEEMRNTARRIDEEIHRNITRTPRLRKIYDTMIERGAEPIRMPLEDES